MSRSQIRHKLLTKLEQVAKGMVHCDFLDTESKVMGAIRETLKALDDDDFLVSYNSDEDILIMQDLAEWFGKARDMAIPVTVDAERAVASNMPIAKPLHEWLIGDEPKVATRVIIGDELNMPFVCLNDKLWVPISFLSDKEKLQKSALVENVLEEELKKTVMEKLSDQAEHRHVKARLVDGARREILEGTSLQTRNNLTSDEVTVCRAIKCGDTVYAMVNHDYLVSMDLLEDEFGMPLEMDTVEVNDSAFWDISVPFICREIERLISEVCPGDFNLEFTDFGFILTHAYKHEKYIAMTVPSANGGKATVSAVKGDKVWSFDVQDDTRYFGKTIAKLAEFCKQKEASHD